jgi:hypothetical protein
MPQKTYARLRRRLRDLARACYDADLSAYIRALDRDGERHWAGYWQARERFLETYAPSRGALYVGR